MLSAPIHLNLTLACAAVFLATYVMVIALNIIQMTALRQFLGSTPSIETEADLERFKKLARLGMYLAISSIPLFILGFLTGIYIVVMYGIVGLILVVGVNAVVFVLGKIGKTLEERARGLAALPGPLEESYRLVSETWVRKALPDF